MSLKKTNKYQSDTNFGWLRFSNFFFRHIGDVETSTFPDSIGNLFTKKYVLRATNGTWYDGDWKGGVLENSLLLGGRILGSTYMNNCTIRAHTLDIGSLTKISNTKIIETGLQLIESMQPAIICNNAKVIGTSINGFYNKNNEHLDNILFENSSLINSTINSARIENSEIKLSTLDQAKIEDCRIITSNLFKSRIDDSVQINSTCSNCTSNYVIIIGGKYIDSSASNCEWSGGSWSNGTWYDGYWKRGIWKEGTICFTVYDKYKSRLYLYISSKISPAKVSSFITSIFSRSFMISKKATKGQTMLVYRGELTESIVKQLLDRIKHNGFSIEKYYLI